MSCIVRLSAAVASCTAFNAHTDPSTHTAVLGPGADLQSVDVSWPGGRFGREMARAHSAVSAEQVSEMYQNVSACIIGIAKLIFSILYLGIPCPPLVSHSEFSSEKVHDTSDTS